MIAHNGLTVITPVPLPSMDAANSHIYKDASDIKSPQLPFGERVAVATGAGGQ
jgi:hypothetical protein